MSFRQTARAFSIESLEARQMFTASTAPDLTLAVVSSSTGDFVGGDVGTITLAIGNDGSQLAVGTESIRVFVSQDGLLNDATFITATQLTGKLSSGASTQVTIPFAFPGVEISSGRLLATVASASQVVDSDLTNDTAVGTAPVSIALPNADLAAQSVSVLGIPSSGIVAGQKSHAIVTVKNVGNVAVTGPLLINLVVADDTAGNGASTVMPAPISRVVNLAPGASVVVPVNFTIPNVEGSKIVLASVDSSAATLETDLANNTVAATPIQISAAAMNLSDLFNSTLPASVVSGSAGHATVRVFNNGNVTFKGVVPTSIYTSLDSQLDSSDERLITSQKSVSIPVGKFQDIPISFNYPTDLPNNNYFLLAQLGSTTTAVAGIPSAGPVVVPISNVSPSATVVNISLPFVTLTPVFGTLPGTAFTTNQTVVLPLNLLNSGNINAVGTYTIQLFATPSTDANDPSAIALTPVITRHLVLKSNSSTAFSFKIQIPNTLVANTTYSFAARLVASAIPAITNGLPAAASAQTFILTA